MTLGDFRTLHPEFRTAPDAMVQSRIDQATSRVAPDIYGDLTERAIEFLAADLLARTPFGLSQRLVDDKGQTTYEQEFEAIKSIVAPRMIVV